MDLRILFGYYIVFSVAHFVSTTTSGDIIRPTSTSVSVSHIASGKASCARIIDKAGNSVKKFCEFPDLFSTETGKCEPFTDVKCGNRSEPKTPCEYPNINCTRPKGENVSLCTCEENSDLNYDMCLNLEDGYRVWPARHWSPFYIRCSSQRTLQSSCDGASTIFNFFENQCEIVYNVVNQAYSLSLSLDIPESLYHLISPQPTDIVHPTTHSTDSQTSILSTRTEPHTQTSVQQTETRLSSVPKSIVTTADSSTPLSTSMISATESSDASLVTASPKLSSEFDSLFDSVMTLGMQSQAFVSSVDVAEISNRSVVSPRTDSVIVQSSDYSPYASTMNHMYTTPALQSSARLISSMNSENAELSSNESSATHSETSLISMFHTSEESHEVSRFETDIEKSSLIEPVSHLLPKSTSAGLTSGASTGTQSLQLQTKQSSPTSMFSENQFPLTTTHLSPSPSNSINSSTTSPIITSSTSEWNLFITTYTATSKSLSDFALSPSSSVFSPISIMEYSSRPLTPIFLTSLNADKLSSIHKLSSETKISSESFLSLTSSIDTHFSDLVTVAQSSTDRTPSVLPSTTEPPINSTVAHSFSSVESSSTTQPPIKPSVADSFSSVVSPTLALSSSTIQSSTKPSVVHCFSSVVSSTLALSLSTTQPPIKPSLAHSFSSVVSSTLASSSSILSTVSSSSTTVLSSTPMSSTKVLPKTTSKLSTTLLPSSVERLTSQLATSVINVDHKPLTSTVSSSLMHATLSTKQIDNTYSSLMSPVPINPNKQVSQPKEQHSISSPSNILSASLSTDIISYTSTAQHSIGKPPQSVSSTRALQQNISSNLFAGYSTPAQTAHTENLETEEFTVRPSPTVPNKSGPLLSSGLSSTRTLQNVAPSSFSSQSISVEVSSSVPSETKTLPIRPSTVSSKSHSMSSSSVSSTQKLQQKLDSSSLASHLVPAKVSESGYFETEVLSIRPSPTVSGKSDSMNVILSSSSKPAFVSSLTLQTQTTTNKEGTTSELQGASITPLAVGIGTAAGVILLCVIIIIIVVARNRKKRGLKDLTKIRLPPELFLSRSL